MHVTPYAEALCAAIDAAHAYSRAVYLRADLSERVALKRAALIAYAAAERAKLAEKEA